MDIKEVWDKIQGLHYTIIAALIAALVSLTVTIINLFLQKKTLKLQQNNSKNLLTNQKIKSKEAQLEEFYKPFNSYLSQNAFLYKAFRNGLPSEFRTLLYLIDQDYLFKNTDGTKSKVTINANNLKTLDEIIFNQDKLCDLIINKGGLIEDMSLIMNYQPSKSVTDILLDADPNKPKNLTDNIGLLSLFRVHCSFIKLAREGNIDKTGIANYERFVYPRELNKKIEENISRLTSEINTLKTQLL